MTDSTDSLDAFLAFLHDDEPAGTPAAEPARVMPDPSQGVVTDRPKTSEDAFREFFARHSRTHGPRY